jgi:2-polyprenyl-3-methyl-5-hydroxy-6-metoxy-1,4-benzoquinol methylase
MTSKTHAVYLPAVVSGVLPIEEFASRSFDVVVACDVVEHISEDVAFVGHLLRVAREFVFFSTPRHRADRPINPYHVREYDPAQYSLLL